jgi:hypothetical protein
VSEYQYYEWQTVDRLLTEDEQQAVRNLSSHIEVSSSRAVVTYSYGSFKHDVRHVLARFFDAHLAPPAETKRLLGTLAEDIEALRARLAAKKKELTVARQESAAKPVSTARMRATALRDLDAAQRRDLFKALIRRVELTPNSIVLEPFDGDPIVGKVLERQGVRSGRWRFVDVDWLN